MHVFLFSISVLSTFLLPMLYGYVPVLLLLFPSGLGVCCLRIITKTYFKSSFSGCLLIFCMHIKNIVVEKDKTELNINVCAGGGGLGGGRFVFTGLF